MGDAASEPGPDHLGRRGAGGVTLDLNGRSLPLDAGFASLTNIAEAMGGRKRFVAAGSTRLVGEILGALR